MALGLSLAFNSGAASANTRSYTTGNSTSSFTVPANVTSMTFDIRGGAGGSGGLDGRAGGTGGAHTGRITGTLSVTPGQVINIYVGSGGGTGLSHRNNSGGGAAGLNPLSGYNGGIGGNAGPVGTSGAGGGGGGSTVVDVGGFRLVAAGGGGAGGGNNVRYDIYTEPRSGSFAVGTDGRAGLRPSGDGGGSGGGGGGFQGGNGGAICCLTNGETFGQGGSAGSSSSGSSGLAVSSFTSGASANGSVTLTYKINQTISFNTLANRTMGTGTFTVSATASSGLAVAFSSGTTGICSVSGSTVTLLAAGTCTIRANQSGSTNFNAASQVSRSFTVSSALSITTPSSGLSGTFNSAYSLTISAAGGATSRNFTLVSGTLPAGLSLNSGTGVISGTPTSAENRSIQIRVTDANSATATTSSFTIAISPAQLSTPNAPTVAATANTLKSLNVSWSAIANASSYTVRVYASNGSTLLSTVTGLSNTSKTITASDFASIADGTTYQISVTAIGTGNFSSSAESTKTSATTLSRSLVSVTNVLAALPGREFTTQPSIRLAIGDTFVSQAGLTVSASVSAGATLTGTLTALTDDAGIATFSNLGIAGNSTVTATPTLTFTVADHNPVTNQFTIRTFPTTVAISTSNDVNGSFVDGIWMANTAAASTINTSTLQTSLASRSTTIQSTSTITVSNSVTGQGGAASHLTLLTTGGNIAMNASVTNSGNITATASGSYSGTGALDSDGVVSIQSTGSTVATAQLTAESNVVIQSSSTSTIGGVTLAGGSVQVDSGGATNLNANISAGAQGILVKSVGRITGSRGASAAEPRLLATAGGPITLWTTGADSGVELANFTELRTTQGGASGADITIGGGSASPSNEKRPGGPTQTSSTGTGNAVELGETANISVVVMRAGAGSISISGEHTNNNAVSGVYIAPGIDLQAARISISGVTQYAANSTVGAAGVFSYISYTAPSLIHATASDVGDVSALNIYASSNSQYAALIGPPQQAGTNLLTLRASADNGSIKIKGETSGAVGLWLSAIALETKNGPTLLDAGDKGITLGRASSSRPFTYQPISGEEGGALTVVAGNQNNNREPVSITTAGEVSFVPPAEESFASAITFPPASSTFDVGSLVVGSPTNTQTVTAGAPVTSAGNITYFGGSFTQQSSSATLSATASGSVIRIVADTSASLSANVNASDNGVVAFETRTSGTAIRVGGTDPSPSLLLDSAQLGDRVSATTLRIGERESTGNIVFNSSLALTNVQNLAIRSSGNVTAANNVTISVANLGIEAGGTINIPGQNGISVIALNGGGANVGFGSNKDYSVATVDSITPVFGLGVKFDMEGVDRTKAVDAFMAVKFNPPPATAVTVRIKDSYGNVLASNNLSAANFAVGSSMSVLRTDSGNPALAGDETTRDGGTHTYSNLRVIDGTGKVAISFTVTRSDGLKLEDAESETDPKPTAVVIEYEVKASEPASISVVFTSETTRAGIAELKPTVTLLDTQGNRLTEGDLRNTKVTVSITGDTGRILGGDDVATVNALASFPNLSIAGKIASATRYTLTFTVNFTNFSQQEITLTTSREISLTAGVATKLALSEDSQTVATRATLSEIVVSVQDDYENVVALAKDIEVAVSTGSAFGQAVTFTGTRDRSTPAGVGSVSYSDLVLQGKADTYTLTFSSDNLASTTHTVRLAHGAANSLTITGPANAANDKDFDTDVVVSIFDADNNPVTTGPQSIQSVALSSATTLTGTREVSASGGIATFTADTLRLIGTQGSKTVTATVLSPSRITADLSVQLGFGDATQLALTTQAAGIANRITFATDPVITVQDSSGNTVTNYAPEIVVASTGVVQGVSASLFGDLDLAPTTGVATFTDLELQGEVGQYDLTFSSGDLTVTTQRVTLTHGVATQLALVSGVTEAVNRQVFGADTVIEARDSSGNPVDNFSADVSVSATAGAGTASGTLSRTGNNNSRVTFGDLVIEGDVGSYVLTFISTGLTGITQAVELNHGTATTLELEISPTAKNNQSITAAVVRIKDADGNLVTSGTPAVTLAGTDLSGTVTVNAASGVATFGDVKFVGVIGPRSVTASISSPSLTSESSTVIVSHGVATQLVLTTSASGAINRAGMTQDAFVTLKDVSGNTVLDSGASVQVAVSSLGSASAELSGTTARTSSSGVAAFTGLGLNGQVGQYTLTYSSADLSDITQTITLTHGAAVKLEIASSADTARSGIDFAAQPVVHVLDFDDNLVTTGDTASAFVAASLVDVPGSATIALSGEAASLQVQASGGIATFTTLRLTGDIGTYFLDYTSGALTKAGQQITVLAGAPASLSILAGTGPVNAIAGEGFGTPVRPIQVELLDAQGNRVLSDSVSEMTATLVEAGNDTSSRGVTVTTARATNGLVSFAAGSALSYSLAGEHKISFATAGIFKVSDSFTITHAAASKLAFQTQPASLRNDLAVSDGFGVAPAIRVLDEFDNPVLSGDALTITAAVTGANAQAIEAISGDTGITSSGTELVSLPNLKLKGTSGSYTLRFTASGFGADFFIDSNTVGLSFGLPSALSVTREGAGARSGIAFDTQPIVEVRDNSNNLVSDSALVLSASVAGRDLVGTGVATASSGVATFEGFGLEGQAATGLVIRYETESPEGATLFTTQEIELAAGDAVKLAVIQQPGTVMLREQFETDVSVQLLDEFDNPVPADSSTQVSIALFENFSVAASLDGGDVSLAAVRATEGVVRFTGLTLPVAPGPDYFLKFTLGSLTITSSQFTVLPGVAARVDITGDPISDSGDGPVAAGELLRQQPQVTLYDADGYVATGSTGTVSVAISTGTDGNLSEGLTEANISNGVAAFSGVRLIGTPSQLGAPAENYRLIFSYNGIESEESENLTVTNAAADRLQIFRPAGNGVAGEAFAQQPIIRILDRFNHIVETGNDSSMVIVASSQNGGDLGGGGFEKQADRGSATFTSLNLGGIAGQAYSLTFEAVDKPAISSATQTDITVTYGSAYQLAIATAPVSLSGGELTKTGSSLAIQPRLEIRDRFNNVVENSSRSVLVTLVRIDEALDPRDRLISGQLTASSGIANFTDLAIVGRPGGQYRLSFGATGLISVSSADLELRHADPVSLQITTEPSSVVSTGVLTKTGAPLHQQPVLRLIDFDGNLATDISGESVSAFVERGDGQVVTELDGAAKPKNTAIFQGGVASFENLSVVAIPGVEQVLKFASTVRGANLISPEAVGVSVTHADPHRLSVLTQPCAGVLVDDVCTSGITGEIIEVPPVAEIQDFFGNRVTNFVGEVTVSTTTARASLSDGDALTPETVTAVVSEGLATFSGLKLVADPGAGVVLNFSSGNLLAATSSEIQVLAARASQLAVITSPTGGRTGQVLAISPVVELRDEFGNRALADDTSRVSVTVSAGTLVGTLTATATAGRVTFSDLVLTATPKLDYTLSFTAVDSLSASLTPASSNIFTISNAFANSLVITQQPTASKTGDLLSATVLELRDFDGNLAEDDSSTVVRVSIHSGDNLARFVDGDYQTVVDSVGSSILRSTASAGVVRFDGIRLVGTPGVSYQLIFTANPGSPSSDYDSAPSVGLSMTHATPFALSVTSGPVADLTGVALTSQPSLRLLDRFGNLATSDSSSVVTAGIYEGAGGVLTEGASATAVAGIVNFVGLTATGTPGELYKLSFTSGLVTVNETAGFRLKKNADIALSYPEANFVSGGVIAKVFETDSDGTPVFSTSSNSSICQVNSSTGAATIRGVGDCMIQVSIPNTTYYYGGVANALLRINKATQPTLQITSSDNVDYLRTLNLSYEGGGGSGRVSFAATGNDCRIAGKVLITMGAGDDCTVFVIKNQDANFVAAVSNPMQITVNRIGQGQLRLANANAVSVGDLTLFTRGGSGDGAITYSITVNGAGCQIIDGNKLRASSNGSCAVMATKGASANYSGAISTEQVITFSKATQSVFFNSGLPEMPVAGELYEPLAEATTGFAVSYSITTGNNVACAFDSVQTQMVRFLASGNCEITATQAGNDQFVEATATRMISVGFRNQTVSFMPVADRRFGQPAFMLSATASSNLAVSYALDASVSPQGCTVTTAGLVTLTSSGICAITVRQGGDLVFRPATPVTQNFRVAADAAGAPHVISVSAANQSITASFNPPSYLGGSTPTAYRLEATVVGTTDRYVNPGCIPTAAPIRCTIVGLPNDVQYNVRVTAITEAGMGTYSQNSLPMTPTSTSSAVTNLVAAPTASRLNLSWSAPVTLESAFASYEVFVWPLDGTMPDTPTQVIENSGITSVSFAKIQPVVSLFAPFSGGLEEIAAADGYFLRVVTKTDSVSQQLTENTTDGAQQSFTTPGIPAAIELTEVGDQLLIGWSAPAFDGGHSILGYQVMLNGAIACTQKTVSGQQVCDNSSDQVFTLAEIEQGEQYSFEVAAVNSLGIGAMATVSHSIPLPPAPAGAGGLAVDEKPTEAKPSKPSNPTRPGSSAPSILNPDSLAPVASGEDSESSTESAATTEPAAPSDGTDTSASGSENDEANFTWLMLLIALLMSGALLRVVIRGRK